ncbi:hypothetical protein [Streptomyces aureus]|uniref:hypothetical protein n=1 Tax=Streptomyces aureus TaxID=193461 RepID=UPI0036A6519F
MRMTLTSAQSPDGVLLAGRAQRLITSATSVGERAAAQALVEEETILARESVQRALGLLDGPAWSPVRWEGLMGRV